MISNELLNTLYQRCEKLENERLSHFITGKRDELWDTHRINMYQFGPIIGLLRERDSTFMSYVNMEPDIEGLLLQIKNFKEQCDTTAKQRLIEFSAGTVTKVNSNYTDSLPLSSNAILDWIMHYHCCLLNFAEGLSEKQKLMYLQLYFGYEAYTVSKRDAVVIDQPGIDALYKNRDLGNTNYDKYNLIPVNQNRKLIVANPCRIFDPDVGKTIFLQISPKVCEVLNKFYKDGLIGMMSFRGNEKEVFAGLITTEYVLEEIEYSLQYPLNTHVFIEQTKLFEPECYGNQLWVSITNTEMRFEELCDDIIIQDEAIVTQLIHLLYKKDSDGRILINHIDHEFIFYSLEEYEKRCANPAIKGKARKRVKTFKVDDAILDVNYPCSVIDVRDANYSKVEVPFILFVLNAYFKHKRLLDEYFEKCWKKV